MSRATPALLLLLALTTTGRADPPAPATLDRDAIRAAVQPHTSELRACYEKHVAKHPAAQGRVTARIVIASSGKVARVTATGIHADVELCVAARIGRWKFPAHSATKPIEVAYPFDFVPEPEPPAPKQATAAAAVDPSLVAMFDAAVAQAAAGKHAKALAGYREILALQKSRKLAAIPRFLATTQLHASYELIDLGKLKDAKAALALVDVTVLGKPKQYDFHFTRGNVLGGLGEVRPMFAAFVEAISVAEDLDDLEVRPPACWTKILAFTMKKQDWAYLREVSSKALQVAQLRGYADLEVKAKVAAAEAQKHLAK